MTKYFKKIACLTVMAATVMMFAGCEKIQGSENNDGTGNQNITGTINGYEYVDLGLPSGLKWATCNVGATTPEDYGNYYAWGEITTKTEYTEENSVTFGQEIGDISGNPTYDAARANWGNRWRMPTRTEMEELVNNCTWTWTTQGSVNGCIVTGPNGNSIFLPASGFYDGSSHVSVGEECYYWSSTPYESDTYGAYSLMFNSRTHYEEVSGDKRRNGHTVRPVTD